MGDAGDDNTPFLPGFGRGVKALGVMNLPFRGFRMKDSEGLQLHFVTPHPSVKISSKARQTHQQ